MNVLGTAASLFLVGLLALTPSAQAPQPTAYVVGAQDVLAITVFGEAELSGRFTVASDGTIDFPWLGRVKMAGLTLREIEEHLTKRLGEGYLLRPQVTVQVEQFRSQSVFVMGEVRSPGKYSLTGEMTLLEVLAQAGGATSSASGEVMIIHPKARRGPVLPEEDEEAQVTRVNLKDLQTGELQVLHIQDGDTIFLPKAETFFISGQVRSPGVYVYQNGLTVLQALAVAGGVTDRGSTRRMRVIRIVDGKKKETGIKLEDLVQPGDTIIVRQRLF